MSERKTVWCAEVAFYDDGTLQQTNGTSFEKWLAEHDAALIEGLAEEWTLDYTRYRKTTELGPVPYLMEKARQRREVQS